MYDWATTSVASLSCFNVNADADADDDNGDEDEDEEEGDDDEEEDEDDVKAVAFGAVVTTFNATGLSVTTGDRCEAVFLPDDLFTLTDASLDQSFLAFSSRAAEST